MFDIYFLVFVCLILSVLLSTFVSTSSNTFFNITRRKTFYMVKAKRSEGNPFKQVTKQTNCFRKRLRQTCTNRKLTSVESANDYAWFKGKTTFCVKHCLLICVVFFSIYFCCCCERCISLQTVNFSLHIASKFRSVGYSQYPLTLFIGTVMILYLRNIYLIRYKYLRKIIVSFVLNSQVFPNVMMQTFEMFSFCL